MSDLLMARYCVWVPPVRVGIWHHQHPELFAQTIGAVHHPPFDRHYQIREGNKIGNHPHDTVWMCERRGTRNRVDRLLRTPRRVPPHYDLGLLVRFETPDGFGGE